MGYWIEFFLTLALLSFVLYISVRNLYGVYRSEYKNPVPLRLLEGLSTYSITLTCGIIPNKKCISFSTRGSRDKQEMILPFSQIEKVSYITWEGTVLVPRDITGEMIFAGLIGSNVMALSSVLDRSTTRAEKVKAKCAMEIVYHPRSDPNITKRIVLGKGDGGAQNQVLQFARGICKHAHLPAPVYIEPIKQGPTYL